MTEQLDPSRFREQWEESVQQEQLLVCEKHRSELVFVPEGELVKLVCPEPECPVRAELVTKEYEAC